MKPFSGFESKNNVSGGYPSLPAGCYVAQILGARVESGQYGDTMLMQVDIIEGEYLGYYRKQYESQQGSNFGQKYKGVYRLRVPADDGTERDQWAKNAFGGAMWAIEQSNPGYHWDWQEGALKGKKVGIAVREHTKTFDSGNRGTFTEIAYLVDVESVRNGTARAPKAKVDPDTAPIAPAAGFAPVETEELPF